MTTTDKATTDNATKATRQLYLQVEIAEDPLYLAARRKKLYPWTDSARKNHAPPPQPRRAARLKAIATRKPRLPDPQTKTNRDDPKLYEGGAA